MSRRLSRRSTGQRRDKKTDRGQKIPAICNCRDSVRRTCGTRTVGGDRSTGRRRSGRQACFHCWFGRRSGITRTEKRPPELKSKKVHPPLIRSEERRVGKECS